MIFYIQYLFITFFAVLARIMPESAFLSIGRFMGKVGFLLIKNRADMSIKNIQMTIEPNFQKAKNIARASFEHFGLVSFELLLTLSGRLDKDSLMDRFINSQDAVLKLKKYHEQSGGKMILVAAHLGNWEILGKYIGANDIPIGVVGREINNPYINEMVAKSRQIFNNTLIDRDGAMLPLAKMLKNGHTVALLPDQKLNDQNSAKVNFLGHLAGTTLSVAKLAKRFDAIMVPVAAISVENNKYTLIVNDKIEFDKNENDIEITQKMNLAIGEMIKQYPSQWFWMHNRWKQ